MSKRYRLKHQQLASELAKKRHSQNRWAVVLGLGRAHLSLLVNGKRPFPTEATRKKLLRGLDVPFSTLFEIEDVPAPGSDRPRHLGWLPRAAPPGVAMPVESLFQEVRHAARSLLQRPVFTATVVLMLALGIGGNTAMFSWVDGILLNPLKVDHPERWVQLGIRQPSGFVTSYSNPNFRDHARLNDVFDEMFAHRINMASFSSGGDSSRVTAALASGAYFRALGDQPAIGRAYNETEDLVPGRDAVAVLSYGFWQRHFVGDRDVVGREVEISAHPYTIIGVMREDFGFARAEPDVDVWVPLAMQEQLRPGTSTLDERGSSFLTAYGRLRPGISLTQARERLDGMHARLAAQYPDSLEGTTVQADAATRAYMGPIGENAVLISAVLMGFIGSVLLIACLNVANLLLARGTDRQQEVGIRVALGASRGRIVRQLLTESLLLSVAAAVAGVALATWLNRLLRSLQPPLPIRFAVDVGTDERVLIFTTVVALLTGLLFGLVPALRTSRADVTEFLHGTTRVSARSRLRSGLVVFQIAISLTLLIGSGLFLRSLGNASSIDPGFTAEDVVTAALDPGLQGYSREEAFNFYRELVERQLARPGVDGAALAEAVPMGLGTQQWGVSVEGYEAAPDERMNIDYNWIGPGYLDTLGMRLVRGRDFNLADNAGADGVVLVNETMADRFWPDGDALGGRLRSAGMDRTVIGIVADAKYYTLGEEPLAFMYFPFEQSSSQTALVLHVKAERDFDTVVEGIRADVHELDASLPIFDIRSLSAQMTVALLPARLSATLLGVFGLFALLLAAVGLYGVMAYVVGQRTREIGIRMALGAHRRQVMSMVMRGAGVLLAFGGGLGLAAGIGLGSVAQSTLYGVSAADWQALGGAFALIGITAMAAAWIPAARASRVSPVEALRQD